MKELDFIGEADQGEEERQRKGGRERKTERERGLTNSKKIHGNLISVFYELVGNQQTT